MSVYEDPDELGYFMDQRNCRQNDSAPGGKPKTAPSHGGYCDPWNGLLANVKPPSSLTVCHLILHPTEQVAISTAARLAHEGLGSYAERKRVQANYDNLGFRPDADAASGTI